MKQLRLRALHTHILCPLRQHTRCMDLVSYSMTSLAMANSWRDNQVQRPSLQYCYCTATANQVRQCYLVYCGYLQ
jgi:hypothetical protein